jgi:transcriptional regulator with XRE-family HTH domain
MSTWLDNDTIAAALKALLKKKGVSAKQLSDDVDIPYRSIQNYLSGQSRIPADILLNICNYVGIEADYFIFRDFRPRELAMYDAAFEALERRELLPAPRDNGEGSIDYFERNRFVAAFTIEVIELYDRYRNDWLARKDRGDRMGPKKRRQADHLLRLPSRLPTPK